METIPSLAGNYLSSITRQFEYYKLLGEKTFAQLSDEELFWQYDTTSNSIAVIVKHLWGNMLSRWTDFLTTDGEKESRDREAEFDNDLKDRADLLRKWEEGWSCLLGALASVNDDNLLSVIYIRNQGHTVMEAINRQLAHYSYHVGQIVLIGKMVRGQSWDSLSIPRGASTSYNENKFAQEKRTEHFTEEYIHGKEAGKRG